MNIQTEAFTVNMVPAHMRVVGSIEITPISILFDDTLLGAVAELKLTKETAATLIAAIQRAVAEA